MNEREDNILREMGMTKARIRQLTKHMRLDVTRIRPDNVELSEFILMLVHKWDSVRTIDLASMARVTPDKIIHTVKLLANAGEPIGVERVQDGPNTATFISHTKLITEPKS